MLSNVIVGGSIIRVYAKQATTIIIAISSTDRQTQHNRKSMQRR